MNIVFDIGGTSMRFARSQGAEFDTPIIVPTPETYYEALGEIRRIIEEVSHGKKIDAIVGGVAGMINRERTALLYAPHLSDWSGKPLKQELSTYTPDVFLENDTALVGLGEAVVGAGAGHRIVAYITISTGVGGVRIVEGEIDENTTGFEPGHHIINMDEDVVGCEGCDTPGHWEYYVGGFDIGQRAGKRASEIDDEQFWDEVTDHIVVGLHNVVLFWSPDIIVIGGGLAMHNTYLNLDTIRERLTTSLSPFPYVPKLAHGTLRDVGGLHGAAVYARKKGIS